MTSFKHLWAPWRMEYIQSHNPKPNGCIFCLFPQEDNDRENLILFKNELSFIILNKFPYNSGHVMVVPRQHTHQFHTLSSKEHEHLQTQLKNVIQAITEIYHPQGFNIGMNMGEAGGAGIREHLHWHIVPRWNGDTNFMPVIAETKAMPQHLLTCYDLLKPALTKIIEAK